VRSEQWAPPQVCGSDSDDYEDYFLGCEVVYSDNIVLNTFLGIVICPLVQVKNVL
jgi:hypothetical protein